MKLLHFAHRGEAQAFIKALELNALDERGNIYQKDKLLLAISGEGPQDSLALISYCLGKFAIKEVINLGIAGSLQAQCKPGEIYSIKVVYGWSGHKPQFQSFRSHSNGKLDCITTDERVLSDEFATKLKPFAAIVDRELWGVAKACQTFNTPFQSFKLISDMAGSSTQCFDLKQRALEFSEKLLEYYLNLNPSLPSYEVSKENIKLPFHTSFSQRKLIEKLVKKINNTELIYKLLDDPSFQNPATLIEELENLVNPIAKKVKSYTSKINTPLTSIGAQVLFDKNFEHKKFKLQMEINSQANIDKLRDALKNLNFEDYEKIWKGDFDV